MEDTGKTARAVRAEITGIRKLAGSDEREDICFLAEGTLRRVAGKWHVLCRAETEADGSGDRYHIILSTSGAEVRRKGAAEMTLVFRPDAAADCFVNTPYGFLSIQSRTYVYSLELKGAYPEVHLEYSLCTGDEPVSENQLNIRVCGLPVR